MPQAQAGALFGLAELSNDSWPPPRRYVHGLAQRGFGGKHLAKPDLQTSKQHDAAEVLSALARERGIALAMPAPTATLIPKWALGHEGVFWHRTFMASATLSSVESRKPAYGAPARRPWRPT